MATASAVGKWALRLAYCARVCLAACTVVASAHPGWTGYQAKRTCPYMLVPITGCVVPLLQAHCQVGWATPAPFRISESCIFIPTSWVVSAMGCKVQYEASTPVPPHAHACLP